MVSLGYLANEMGMQESCPTSFFKTGDTFCSALLIALAASAPKSGLQDDDREQLATPTRLVGLVHRFTLCSRSLSTDEVAARPL